MPERDDARLKNVYRVIDELSALVEICQFLESNLDLRENLGPVLEMLSKVVPCKGAAIILFSDPVEAEDRIATSGELSGESLQSSDTVISKVRRAAQTAVTDDPWSPGNGELIACPVGDLDAVDGVLLIRRESAEESDKEADLRLLAMTGKLLSRALNLRRRVAVRLAEKARHLPRSATVEGSLQVALDDLEHTLIVESLKANGGIMSRAAKDLGLTERIMGLRVKKYGIDLGRFKKR